MSVCNINITNIRKSLFYSCNIIIFCNLPYYVMYTVNRCKIIYRRFILYFFNNFINDIIGTISKKYRTCLSITCINMLNSVYFLIFSCILMLFNNSVNIIVNRCTANNTGLVNVRSLSAHICKKHYPRLFHRFHHLHSA